MRRKRRYLAVEAMGRRLDWSAFARLVTKSHMDYVGVQGYHLSSPRLISYDEDAQRGVVRTYLAGLSDLRASLAMVVGSNEEPLLLRTIGVSGTLRSCEDRFIRKSRALPPERAEKRNGEEDPGMQKRLARIKAIVPGSRITVHGQDFKLKRVHDDGRVDLSRNDESFGFTVLDLSESNLGNEG
jgi:RNase P/RNase MRP subunit POP5